MTMAARKQTVELEVAAMDSQSVGPIVPMTFDADSKGSVFGRYNGYTVYKDRDSPIDLESNHTYYVRLKDKTLESGCYFAIGIREVDASFFLNLTTGDKMAFLQSVFFKGGKPSDALLEGLSRSSPEICDRLERGSELIEKQVNLNDTINMYKTKLDNANQSLRKKNDEIRKLKEQVNSRQSKDGQPKDDSKELRKELSESENRVRELEESLAGYEEQVARLNGTISNMEFSMNLERQELVDRVDQAERARDAVVKARREREEALDRRERELDERERNMGAPVIGVSEEAYEGVHAELDRALSELDSVREENSGLVSQMAQRDRLIDALGTRISELTKANTEVRSHIPAYETVFRPNVTVRRDSRTTVSSDWFTEPRYTVLMSGDASRLLIRPDPEGKVECTGYALNIPKLATLRPFDGNTYLKADFAPDMGSVEVVL